MPRLINESRVGTGLSISGQAVTACHIVRQGLSKLQPAKRERKIIFH